MEDSGAQYVMTFGTLWMHLLSVHKLDFLQKVCWCQQHCSVIK